MTFRVAMIGDGLMGGSRSVGWRQAPRIFDLAEKVGMADSKWERVEAA